MPRFDEDHLFPTKPIQSADPRSLMYGTRFEDALSERNKFTESDKTFFETETQKVLKQARLHNAAEELLAAAESVLEWASDEHFQESVFGCGCKICEMYEKRSSIFNRLKQAISKAKGEKTE